MNSILERVNHALLLGEHARHLREVLRERLPGDGEAIAVQVVLLQKRLQYGWCASDVAT